MTTDDTTPQPFDPPAAIPGDPLLPAAEDDAVLHVPAGTGSTTASAGTTPGPIGATAPPADVPPVSPVAEDLGANGGRDREDEGTSKLKAGALLAGAAALANKVRQEAPKKVHELREKRAEGRCVIVTEVDGRMLAIGPYKDAASAEQQAFRVGGDPHVVELVTDAAFFAPAQEASAS